MQGTRQATTSHGRRGNSTQQNAGGPGGGHTLQSKWARLIHGGSPEQVVEGQDAQMVAAMSMAFSPNNMVMQPGEQKPGGPSARYYAQRPGTQGGIAMGAPSGSPTSMGSGGVHDVAARVKKYK